MSTDDLREKLADTIRAAEPYIYADPADASELADALLPIIDAHAADLIKRTAPHVKAVVEIAVATGVSLERVTAAIVAVTDSTDLIAAPDQREADVRERIAARLDAEADTAQEMAAKLQFAPMSEKFYADRANCYSRAARIVRGQA